MCCHRQKADVECMRVYHLMDSGLPCTDASILKRLMELSGRECVPHDNEVCNNVCQPNGNICPLPPCSSEAQSPVNCEIRCYATSEPFKPYTDWCYPTSG